MVKGMVDLYKGCIQMQGHLLVWVCRIQSLWWNVVLRIWKESVLCICCVIEQEVQMNNDESAVNLLYTQVSILLSRRKICLQRFSPFSLLCPLYTVVLDWTRPLAAYFKSQIFLSINWHVFITVIVYCSELLNHSFQPHCRRMICDELFEKPCCSLNSLRVGQ